MTRYTQVWFDSIKRCTVRDLTIILTDLKSTMSEMANNNKAMGSCLTNQTDRFPLVTSLFICNIYQNPHLIYNIPNLPQERHVNRPGGEGGKMSSVILTGRISCTLWLWQIEEPVFHCLAFCLCCENGYLVPQPAPCFLTLQIWYLAELNKTVSVTDVTAFSC